MSRVVGVRFKTAGKVYFFDPGEFELAVGDGAVVETARGVEMGLVASAPREVPEEEIKQPLKKVVRKATPEDLARRQENEERAQRAFSVGQQKIATHNLPMKLVEVEYTLDGSKIVFYFTAESRVDFRDLVKDLASTFRTRIELRQIGVRDEAKLLGGLGACGRQLCCQAFLGDFVPVSIRMAKEQNLSLNPTKISGICGRLMCCLNFESEAYREAKRLEKERAAAEAARVQETAGGAEAPAAADEGAAHPERPAGRPMPPRPRPAPPAQRLAAGAQRPTPSGPRPASRPPEAQTEAGPGAGPAADGSAERTAAARRRRRHRRPGGGEKGPGEGQVSPAGPPDGQSAGQPSGQPSGQPQAPLGADQGQPAGDRGGAGSNHRNRRRRRGPRPGGPGGPAGDSGTREGSPAE